MVAGIAEWGLGAARVLMSGAGENEGFFRGFNLIEGGKHARGGACFVDQAEADERWTFDARCEIYNIEVAAGIVDRRWILAICIIEPLRPAAASPDFRPEHIATGGNQGHGGGDFGMKACDHQRLQTALAVAGDGQCFAIPIRSVLFK